VRLALEDVGFVGRGLKRPECVVADARDRLHAANWDGGVTVIEPDGRQYDVLARESGFALKPNGVCLLPEGGWLVTHLGEETGGVFHLDRQGRLTPFLTALDGEPLPPTNFVHRDAVGRTWVTVSTRLRPRIRACRADVEDGFVALVEADGHARIVADGLGYANECVVAPGGGELYLNETFQKRTTAFTIGASGDLTARRVVATYGEGVFPDGLTFDAEGGVWITSIVSNRVIRLDAAGGQETILADAAPAHVARVERAWRAGALERGHLDSVEANKLRNISSLTFGGADQQTIHLGCLSGDAIATARVPWKGLSPPVWPA